MGAIRTVRTFANEAAEVERYNSRVDSVYQILKRVALLKGGFYGGVGLAGQAALVCLPLEEARSLYLLLLLFLSLFNLMALHCLVKMFPGQRLGEIFNCLMSEKIEAHDMVLNLSPPPSIF